MDKLLKLVVVLVVLAIIVVLCVLFKKPIIKTLTKYYKKLVAKKNEVSGRIKSRFSKEKKGA